MRLYHSLCSRFSIKTANKLRNHHHKIVLRNCSAASQICRCLKYLLSWADHNKCLLGGKTLSCKVIFLTNYPSCHWLSGIYQSFIHIQSSLRSLLDLWSKKSSLDFLIFRLQMCRWTSLSMFEPHSEWLEDFLDEVGACTCFVVINIKTEIFSYSARLSGQDSMC